MKYAIASSNDIQKIVKMLDALGLSIISEDDERPDFVITYGGDGTILYGERIFPGIPKITVRGSEGGYKCLYEESDLESVLLEIEDGEYVLREEMKLETQLKGKHYTSFFTSLNEIQLHNPLPTKAVRFSVYEDLIHEGIKPLFENIIGDGVVVATPFGSTAYYESIGGKKFDKGIGIALNNPYKVKTDRCPNIQISKFKIVKRSHISNAPTRVVADSDHIIIDDSSKVIIKVLRDDGLFASDNDDRIIDVKDGDEILVKVSKETAKFVITKFSPNFKF